MTDLSFLSSIADPAAISALIQVLMIDLVLAGDNAVIVGMAAAGLPAELRRKAILGGIAAAAVLRIAFAAVTVQLLAIIGLTLAGGILLLWVAWKMARELAAHRKAEAEAEAAEAAGTERAEVPAKRKTLGQALLQIVVADVSMSLDNVLAVAGAANEHPYVMVLGLALSVILMGVASSLIARLLARHQWIAYIGLALIAYVAVHMIWEGAHEVAGYL